MDDLFEKWWAAEGAEGGDGDNVELKDRMRAAFKGGAELTRGRAVAVLTARQKALQERHDKEIYPYERQKIASAIGAIGEALVTISEM